MSLTALPSSGQTTMATPTKGPILPSRFCVLIKPREIRCHFDVIYLTIFSIKGSCLSCRALCYCGVKTFTLTSYRSPNRPSSSGLEFRRCPWHLNGLKVMSEEFREFSTSFYFCLLNFNKFFVNLGWVHWGRVESRVPTPLPQGNTPSVFPRHLDPVVRLLSFRTAPRSCFTSPPNHRFTSYLHLVSRWGFEPRVLGPLVWKREIRTLIFW